MLVHAAVMNPEYVDPHYYKHYYRPQIVITQIKTLMPSTNCVVITDRTKKSTPKLGLLLVHEITNLIQILEQIKLNSEAICPSHKQ
jgi:hypothetical protein